MPRYDVTVRYRLEYVGTKTVKAANEEKARGLVERGAAGISSLADFERYIEESIDEEVNEIEIEGVDEI